MAFETAELAGALENGDFAPYFQPIVELRTGQLEGFEVLARWRHRTRGIVSPDDFIPKLDRNGLIEKLTESMLDQAFALPALHRTTLSLAVNIAPIELVDRKLPDQIAAAASRANFHLTRLTVEVTESALVDDLARAQDVAADLKALGCKLSLDDFGTGYSSLKHLHALPFDQLKVDRSFVSTMAEQRGSRKIVASVIGLGQSLGLTTVAEGVETQEQADMLYWMGCNLVQGWLYGKPVASVEIEPAIVDGVKVFLRGASALDQISSGMDAQPGQRLAQLQAIYDGAPVGLCMLDSNLRYVSLNRRLAEMNRIAAVNHIGRSPAEVVPEIFRRVESSMSRALAGEPVLGIEIEKPAKRPGEENQSLICSYHPVRDEAGEVVGVSVAVMDISDHRRVQRALRESAEHLRNMIRLSPHVPWVLNTRGEVIESSPRWESFTGQPIEQALGHGWKQVLHPDDLTHTEKAINDALQYGWPIDINYRVRAPSGEWLWMRSRGAARRGPSGKIMCIYGIVELACEARKVSQEVRDCMAELRAALEIVPFGILIADATDGSIFMVNPGARKILCDHAFPGQTMESYGAWELMDTDGRLLDPMAYPLARAILGSECVEPQPLLVTGADGYPARISVSANPVHAKDGQLIGGIMMLRPWEIDI